MSGPLQSRAEVLGVLEQVRFHDLPFVEIRFRRPDVLVLVVATFNEVTRGYNGHEFTFHGVEAVDLAGEDLSRIEEIFSLEVDLSGAFHQATFVLLGGFGDPDFKLSFRFLSVTRADRALQGPGYQ